MYKRINRIFEWVIKWQKLLHMKIVIYWDLGSNKYVKIFITSLVLTFFGLSSLRNEWMKMFFWIMDQKKFWITQKFKKFRPKTRNSLSHLCECVALYEKIYYSLSKISCSNVNYLFINVARRWPRHNKITNNLRCARKNCKIFWI